tara:strand:+ start:1548 stop:1982 length:435 start_codon:yes stop_codon:yes gene_type:complete
MPKGKGTYGSQVGRPSKKETNEYFGGGIATNDARNRVMNTPGDGLDDRTGIGGSMPGEDAFPYGVWKKGGKALKKGKSLKNTKPAFKNTKGGLKNTKGGIKSTKGKPKKDRGWKKDLSPKVVINDASTWKKGRSLKGKSKLKRS